MRTISSKAVVIGAGPGGYPCAIHLRQLGVQTTVIEREFFGGICTHVGCIPSKAIITASKIYNQLKHIEQMGIQVGPSQVNFSKTQQWKQEVIAKLSGGVRGLLRSNGADILLGEARFVGPHELSVQSKEGEIRVTAEHIVIATGSRPRAIPGFAIDKKRVLDSTGALALSEIPKHLLVIGGGYIGLELGMAYAKFGSQVTVVEMTGGLLPGTDPELTKVVQKRMKQLGMVSYVNTKASGFEEIADGLRVKLAGPEAPSQVDCDRILVTVGRRPNSDLLDLGRAGVKLDAKGFIATDSQRKANVPGIYAIGDIAGQPMLAHKATKEGEVVAEVIAGHRTEYDVRCIPAVIFTDPEIATCGLSEEERSEER